MARILLHDYAGHPFQFDLSRELAKRGHIVWHCYSSDTEGAKASFDDSDIPNLKTTPISIGYTVRKYQFVKRWIDEIRYGRRVSATIKSHKPDIVINSNTPLDSYKIIRKAEDSSRVRKIFWAQDLNGHAVFRIFRKKWFPLGYLIGQRFLKLEAKLLRGSDHIVSISEDFIPRLLSHGAQKGDITVIHNWAPVEEMPICPRENGWRNQHFDSDTFLFLYSGTLGLKHNPEMLLNLAREIESQGTNAKVLVISEGLGADWLKSEIQQENCQTLIILPYQPFEQLPEILASGDILLTVLESDAGVYSVPSKILSYMCAGKPQLAAMPSDNLGASLIRSIECGNIVAPGDSESFVQKAMEMYATPRTNLQDAGSKAREFAQGNFNIKKIADRFELLLE